MNEEHEQDITLAVLNIKIENICQQLKDNKEDHIILKETLKWQEEKRCKKNDFILETINKSIGKTDEKIERLKQEQKEINKYHEDKLQRLESGSEVSKIKLGGIIFILSTLFTIIAQFIWNVISKKN